MSDTRDTTTIMLTNNCLTMTFGLQYRLGSLKCETKITVNEPLHGGMGRFKTYPSFNQFTPCQNFKPVVFLAVFFFI